MNVDRFVITDSRTLVCEFCDRKVPGRIRFELYGGALMVCEHCHDLLYASRSHPYSKIMDKFCLHSCGYRVNVKFARSSTLRYH